MKFSLRGASSAAIIIGMSSTLPMWAQQASDAVTTTNISGPQQASSQVDQTARGPQEAGQGQAERVVVTGSLIQGSAEDAALPVEVFTNEELEEQGAPTALEFVKTLTASGPTVGEAYYFGGAGLTGSPSFNLRGIGADKTLTLLNGRRVSQNAALIPSIAVARTEILKDGAAVTYGADATGGVVNFITRDNFVGLEASAQYKYIDSSDGDYGLAVLGGFGEGDTNFVWSAEWEHRSRLNTLDRPGITQPSLNYDGTNGDVANSAPWSTLTNLGTWIALGPRPAIPTGNSYNQEYGATRALVYDFTPASCAAVGGVYGGPSAVSPLASCAYNYIPYYNLVENQDTFRAYAQLNSVISDNVEFHMDAAFGVVDVPEVYGSPSQPVVRGPGRAAGLTQQYYVPRTNPGWDEFAQRSGLVNSPFYNLGPGIQGAVPITYRPLAHGGNPVLGGQGTFGVPSRINNSVWRVSSGLSGDLAAVADFLEGISFDVAATYNQSNSEGDAADVLTYRFQEALSGFGGPNCNAVDQNPYQFGTQNPAAAGQNGCLYWNPFASNFSGQPMTGATNPNYVPGLENDPALYSWIVNDRFSEDIVNSLTIDAVFSGETGIALPGGNVSWGLGTQWRQVESREIVPDDLYNGNTPCIWPTNYTTGVDTNNDGFYEPISQNPFPTSDPRHTGCAGGEGPFQFFGINPPDYADRQQFSYFGELAIPLHDRVNLQAAVRREDFSGGLGATVYKISGKWDIFGPLSLRGSYGTNYQTPPIGLIPGEVTNVVRSYDRAARNWKAFQLTTRADVQAEEATAWNAGLIWQSQGFSPDHDFRFIVDYFDIETENEIAELASHNQILFASTLSTTSGGFNLIDCSSPFISRIDFSDTPTSPGGACVQGQTTSNDFSVIRSEVGNAFGQTTNGIDYQMQYRMPVGMGDLTLDVTATQVTEQTVSERTLDGIVVEEAEDRLGFLNFSTVGVPVPEWRVNSYAAFSFDRHTIRGQVNYVSAVTDERTGTQYAENGDDWISTNLYYLFDVTDDLRLSLAVENIFDKDPPPAQIELGYDPRAGGNALGRTIELGIKKTF